MTEAGDRAWDQEVGELNLEQLGLLVHDEERTIDRLDNHHRGLVRPEVADEKIVRVPLQLTGVDFLVLQEGLMMDDDTDRQLP